MHTIFKVNELLALIVLQLSHDGETLVRIAQTCKLFLTAALPIIWRELPSVVPLLKLLPNEAVLVDYDWKTESWTIVSTSFHVTNGR
jgi:hypothetical protein